MSGWMTPQRGVACSLSVIRQIDVPPPPDGRTDERRIGLDAACVQISGGYWYADTHRSRAGAGDSLLAHFRWIRGVSLTIISDNLCTATVQRTASSVRACVRARNFNAEPRAVDRASQIPGESPAENRVPARPPIERPPRRTTARSCCCFDTLPVVLAMRTRAD